MFCCIYPDRFDDRHPLKPFKFHGIRIAFYGYYYPSRYNDFLNEAQRTFCRTIYRFKQGEIHGIEFFKACMTAIQADGKPYHIMFMPCSNWIKYEQRFKRLNWYMSKHRPGLTSGLYDTVICDARESLHEADGADSRVLERNYEITGDIKGKEIIIIDDVLTTGQSVSDYKEDRTECVRLQGGNRKARRQGGGRHFLWKDVFHAADVRRPDVGMGRQYQPCNQREKKVIVRPVPKHIPAVLS